LERAVLYVDGFNFYYGVTNHWRTKKGLAGLGWCNFRALVERHFPLGGAQLDIKYFTAPVRIEHETPAHRKDEHQRYGIWARAVRTIGGVRVVEGFHKAKSRSGNSPEAGGEVLNPDAPAKSREEKQSDINLAIEVMLDALGPRPPSQAYLLSDDRDLMPVVFALLERIRIPIEVVVLLPSRADAGNWLESYHQTAVRLYNLGVSGRDCVRIPTVISLSEEILASSLLRYALNDSDGSFECLDEWRLTPSYLGQYCTVPEWRPDSSSKIG
jgi:hypothetical protein